MERAEARPQGRRSQATPKCVGSSCVSCGEVREIQAKGLCSKCYCRQWRKTENRQKWNSGTYPKGCVTCGTTASKHQGKGLCSSCYSKEYAQGNRDRLNELGRLSYHKHRIERRTKLRERYATDLEYKQKHRKNSRDTVYGGNRIPALERAGYSCEVCSYVKVPEILHVHHKDRNRSNNDLSNLQVLCPNCHCEIHQGS